MAVIRRASILGVVSAEAVQLVRGFDEYSAGRDLVEALADEQYVAAGHAAFDLLAARDFEFVLEIQQEVPDGCHRTR